MKIALRIAMILGLAVTPMVISGAPASAAAKPATAAAFQCVTHSSGNSASGYCDNYGGFYQIVIRCWPDTGDPGVDDRTFYGSFKYGGSASYKSCPDYYYLDDYHLNLF